MFDFVNSNELYEELKANDIYNLFKTDSLEFNKQFLSILEKYPNTFELIGHYIKIDNQNVLSLFNNILLTISKIINAEITNSYISEYELYTSGVSKIISLLCLLQKINHLQNELIIKTKNSINNFYKINKKESLIKEKIEIFINDIISSQLTPKRSMSRRSTNDITNTSISFHFENNIIKNKLKENESNLNNNKKEYLILRSYTPKFDDSQNLEANNINNYNVKEEFIKKDLIKVDSSLTLQKMNFVQDEENKENKINKTFKKHKSHKIKNKSCESFSSKRKKNKSNSHINKESLFSKNRKISMNSENRSSAQNERIQLIVEFLDAINILFKDGKINSNQKISIKQIIISNPNSIINKFYQYNSDVNNNNNKNIQCFLLEELNTYNI